jgi:PAS domain S-box-containing protein
MPNFDIIKKIPFRLFIIFLGFTLCFIIIGYFYYQQENKKQHADIYYRLNEIVELKVEQLNNWRRDKIIDARSIFLNPIISEYVREFTFNGRGNTDLLNSYFEKITKSYPEYLGILMVDSHNRIINAYTNDDNDLGQHALNLIEIAKSQKEIVLSDFHRKKDKENIHIDIAVPLYNDPEMKDLLCMFLIRINPQVALYKLIQAWPIPSKSAESMLVRSEGDEVVYLNELRFKKNAALNFRLPLNTDKLPAAMAINGKEGIVEGIDYRGVKTIAGIKKVPDSPWFLVAKIDYEEVSDSINAVLINISFSIFFLILITALSIILVWRQQRVSFYKRLYQEEFNQKSIAKQYEYLTKYANDIILLMDSNHKIVDVNESAIKEYQYSRDEFLKLSDSDLELSMLSMERQGVSQRQKLNGGELFETYHKRKDGSHFPVEISARMMDIEGKMYIHEIVRDISEKRKYEDELRETSSRYLSLFEYSPISIWEEDFSEVLKEVTLLKAQNINDIRAYCESNPEVIINWCSLIKIIDVNQATYDIYETSNFEDFSKGLKNFVTEESLPFFKEEILSFIEGKERFECSIWIETKKGRRKYVNLSAVTVSSENFIDRFHVLVSLVDMTERKKHETELSGSNKRLEDALNKLKETQKQLLQEQRLLSLSQLASGIAHDINNSLSPILGYADLLLDEDDTSFEMKKWLSSIKNNSLDIKKTIERMKEFYRKREDYDKLIPVKLDSVINSSIDLTRHKWKNISESEGIVIEIKKEFEDSISTIKGNESELKEMFTNLIFNSCDAMPKGGIITIKIYSRDNFLFCEVSDNGCGMDNTTRLHCFDPFYSTKGEKGSGLGLSMVYGVVQRHEGEINVDSLEGKGATFKMKFPVLVSEEIASAKIRRTLEIPSLKILCIDDDEEVLELMSTIFGKYNHKVKTVDSGKAGIEIFLEEYDKKMPFDIVITDLGMPYMDGNSVANIIKKKNSNTPVILLTGWGAFLEKVDKKNINYILKKPIVLEELFTAIKTVLHLV